MSRRARSQILPERPGESGIDAIARGERCACGGAGDLQYAVAWNAWLCYGCCCQRSEYELRPPRPEVSIP